jgi:uracil-DNA glycosylase
MAADLNAFPSVWRALLDADASTHLELAIAKAEGELAHAKHVLPPREKWFAALHHTAPEKVRVVIVGQDPYPTLGNAMGLAFSVPRGVAVPASLRNIYKGMTNDLDLEPALHGDLSTWAAQGVLLLNNVLTVEEGAPNSHAKFGWQQVTDRLITAIGSASAARKYFCCGARLRRRRR